MSRFTYEGRVQITHVPADGIADISAPTIAEIGAGTDFTMFLPTAGIGISHSQNMASLPMVNKGQVAQSPGTETVEAALTFVFDDVSNDPFEYFENGLAGFLVRSLMGFTGTDGAPAAGDPVAVYKCVSGNPQPNAPAQDEFAQHVVNFGVEEWDVKALVAAA